MKQFIAQVSLISLILSASLIGFTPAVAQQVALTASITAPTEGQSLPINQAFVFSGAASGGNDVFYSYLWNFGDGTFGAGDTFTKTYTEAGAKTVTLTVADHDGTQASVTRNITVTAPAGETPTVDLLVNGGNGPVTLTAGNTASLSWTSHNVNTCTASGAWSGSKQTTGTEVTSALTVGTYTYTLECTGSTTTSDSVTVIVTSSGNPSTTPVITNIRVDGVTQTSAVIHWTTDIPADSRVIYDTVSHPTLGGAPNFGYAFSTDTTDASPKVTEHTVTLTGLSANTQYFFRVLSHS